MQDIHVLFQESFPHATRNLGRIAIGTSIVRGKAWLS